MDTTHRLDRMFQPPAYSLNEYQKDAMRTSGHYENNRDEVLCAALGLSGEAGEFLEAAVFQSIHSSKISDMIKKKYFHLKPVDDLELMHEAGDVLWYLAKLCHAKGWSMESIAVFNIEKLKRRYPEGFSYKASNERKE